MDQWTENGSAATKHVEKIQHKTKPSQIYDQLGNKGKHIAWTVRLRTGHCSLNQYLERLNIIDETECECKQGKETVRHFLLVCQERERDKLRKETGMHGMKVEKSLGDASRIKNTMQFIEDIQRFDF